MRQSGGSGGRPVQRHQTEQHGVHPRVQRHRRVQPPTAEAAVQLVPISDVERHPGGEPNERRRAQRSRSSASRVPLRRSSRSSSDGRTRRDRAEAAAGTGRIRPQRAPSHVPWAKAAAVQPHF